VFVHGILSDNRSCWTALSGSEEVFWPDLIGSDARCSDFGVFLAGYYTAVDAGEFALSQCAREVFEALERPDITTGQSVLSAEQIVFVTHSTGGIVARYLIERQRTRFANKTVGLVLLASPSLGSHWANLSSIAAKYYGNKLAGQLRWRGENLLELHGRFKDLVDRRSELLPGLVGVEAAESSFILRSSLPRLVRSLLPNRLRVVSTSSAAQYFGEVKVIPDTDHFTIAKPSGHDHPSHEFLVTFLDRFSRSSRQTGLEPTLDGQAGRAVPGPDQPADERALLSYALMKPEELAERPGAFLVVDDEPMIRDTIRACLRRQWPDRDVYSASEGSGAVAILEAHRCALVVTDLLMPGCSGLDLMEEISKRWPEQGVIGVSGYGSADWIRRFLGLGGLVFLDKPFTAAEFNAVVHYALRQRESSLLRLLGSSGSSGEVPLLFHHVAGQLRRISRSATSSQAVVTAMLRHKAYHSFQTAMKGLRRSPEAVLLNLRTQLDTLSRLRDAVSKSAGSFEDISRLVSDLGSLHSRTKIHAAIPAGRMDPEIAEIAVLLTAELVDNAVAATDGVGDVNIRFIVLPSLNRLKIEVQDSGPGISADVAATMFNEGSSTKGAGRGLGLHLVRESVSRVGGSIRYQTETGFEALLPLDLLTKT
jgi:DNA-binding response OmpR family regulator